MDGLNNEYVAYLYSLVADEHYMDAYNGFGKIFTRLYTEPFVWFDQMFLDKDACRAERGVRLRDDFAEHAGYPKAFISNAINEDASVLEVLIGLAMDIEWLMEDDYLGDRTSYWFWSMLHQLGLVVQNKDYEISEDVVDRIIDMFLQREYDEHGNHGGLFYVENPRKPMYSIDLWMQAQYWMTTVDDIEEE